MKKVFLLPGSPLVCFRSAASADFISYLICYRKLLQVLRPASPHREVRQKKQFQYTRIYNRQVNTLQKEGETKFNKNQCWNPLVAVDDEPALPFNNPLSAGGDTPHLLSDSVGSITLTDPSINPTANWFGSWGCAATTTGYTDWLLVKYNKHHHS